MQTRFPTQSLNRMPVNHLIQIRNQIKFNIDKNSDNPNLSIQEDHAWIDKNIQDRADEVAELNQEEHKDA